MPSSSLRLPDANGALIRHVLYPLWALRNGSQRLRYLAQLEASQYWPRERHAEQQWLLFKAMVAHAFNTSPFYRRKFSEAGFEPGDLKSLDDVRLLPMLDKEEVQEHRAEMVSTWIDPKDLILDMTGGSTGSPMQFHYDKDRLDSRVGATLRHNRWAGWKIGDKAAILWGAPQDTKVSGKVRDRIRTWVLDRRLILDASTLNESAMARFARALVEYRPVVLQAYSNTLGLFARFVRDEGITGIRPESIVCSAEVLTDENRVLIEETFGCKVFNRYGCREFAVIASECDRHQGMHINAENLLVEVNQGTRAAQGGTGEVVITDLRNFAMPMIRYRIRDMGRLLDGACSCARGLPLMELSGGRVTDFLRAINGERVSGVVFATYVITNIPGVRQIQFVQNEPGSVTVNLVKGPNWQPESLKQLTARVHQYLGAGMTLRWEFRDQIPLERSGKYRFSVSNLD